MDPASAAVAFIGVAASLTTLAALVIDSSKTLLHVRHKFKNVPEDIRRLCERLDVFQCLLYEAQGLVRDHGPDYAASDVGTVFAAAIEHMIQDMRDFKDTVQKLKGLTSQSTSSKNLFVSHVRHILKEDCVREYEGLISSHVATLTLQLEILIRSAAAEKSLLFLESHH